MRQETAALTVLTVGLMHRGNGTRLEAVALVGHSAGWNMPGPAKPDR